MTPLTIEPLASVIVAGVGLILGSFVNVCIHRLPRGESVVWPGSRCPACAAPVRWFDNVPVLSWIALRGRCRGCRRPISWRYPAVELLASGSLVLAWRAFGLGVAFFIAGGFALAMIVLFFTDLDHRLLPDAVTLSGFAVGLSVAWFNPFLDGGGWERVWRSLSGAALGAGLLWGVGSVYGRIRGVEAMGLGDVKMMAMVGAFCGPAGVVLTIFAASLVGAATGLALIPLRGGSLRDALPFGCFLAPASLVALLWGQRIVEAYVGALLPPP